MISPKDTQISSLGPCQVLSPLGKDKDSPARLSHFIDDATRIRYLIEHADLPCDRDTVSFEKAGPREKIFFDPKKIGVGIVTCGGLSPGINNVIRSLVLELTHNYGVKHILGFRYGLSGFRPDAPPPLELNQHEVQHIHKLGGTILGSSRGPIEPKIVLETLAKHNIELLFCVGGDGTQRAAHKIAEEISKQGLKKAVIGIPKTIDNDVPFVFSSFGFATAVEEASSCVQRAAVEAHSFANTVSIVKLMGRNAGFISAHATLAAQDVDFTLVPESSFRFEGATGLLALLEKKIKSQGFAIIVASEGAGQDLFVGAQQTFDPSGNRQQQDIGSLLRERIDTHLRSLGIKANIRYFDPGYSIRAVPANVSDAYYCDLLARAAVHAGMAGKTDLLIGLWYNNLTHVPLALSTSQIKAMDPERSLWRNVIEVTGQPLRIGATA